jgi:exopolysaccharide production protein ExoZ
MSNGDQQIRSIQALRGIAALAVVLYHFTKLASEQSTARSLLWETGIGTVGAAGVDLFFIISGFVMVISAADRGTSPISFLACRALRIYPLYWFWTTLLLALTFKGYFTPEVWSSKYLVASYLLLPYTDIGPFVEHVPLLGQGWTLSYEIYFYLIFALCLQGPKRFPVVRTVIALAVTGAAAVILDAPAPIRYVAASPLILEFAFGMLAARFYQWTSRRWPCPRSQALPLAILCVGGIWALSAVKLGSSLWAVRSIAFGIPCLAILIGAVMFELAGRRPGRLLCNIGNASYSIYLSHGVILACVSYWLSTWHHPLKSPDLFALIGSMCATLFGIATYKLIEQPLGRHTRLTLRVNKSKAY